MKLQCNMNLELRNVGLASGPALSDEANLHYGELAELLVMANLDWLQL